MLAAMGLKNRGRVVTTSGLVPKRGRLWAYGYADLARLLGCGEDHLRHLVAGGKLDPGDLGAVCSAWLARAARTPATPQPR